ncbi:fimbrillin family protein [Parabacteroides sp. OttesenSCG-928-G07]|nr:fimbrillin family protein [Parabacteroides sp. OttesenSCG-928-G07]
MEKQRLYSPDRYEIISTALCLLVFLFSCTQEDEKLPDLSGEIEIRAMIYNNGISSRAELEEPTDGLTGYLYLPMGSFGLKKQQLDSIVYDGTLSAWKYKRFPLHWDDIQSPDAEITNDKKQFYLANTDQTNFPEGTNEDLLWGKAEGWLEPLEFNLKHSMSKLTFVYVDKTLKNDIDFSNAKIVIYTEMSENNIVTSNSKGLFRKAHTFDWTTGEVKINANTTPRENKTVATLTKREYPDSNGDKIATLEVGIVPPQEFADSTKLEITAGEYVYRIALPEKMYLEDDDKGQKIELLPGEHLTITIILTEDEIDFEATLTDWEDKKSDPIEVSRVFNIGSWEEMKDLMLAINTGYTFHGMVVRLTNDIYIDGEVNLGTKLNPFEGIFDGNDFQIFGLGQEKTVNESKEIVPNVGGLFGYTRGATIQNVTLVYPHVTSTGALGALVDVAENTTIFNCRDIANSNKATGSVIGYGSHTGGMVGEAKGNTSLTNCYTILSVRGEKTSESIGGLVGYTEGAVTHCSAQGSIDAIYSSQVGGLIGYSNNSVLNCCAWGTVKGDSKVGGLVGNSSGQVSNSYSLGSIANYEEEGKYRGSLIGNKEFAGVVQNCLWFSYGGINIIGSGTLNEASNMKFEDSSLMTTVQIERLNKDQADVWAILSFEGKPRAYFRDYKDVDAHEKKD